jgi:N-acetylmuramoyl-L-alanine amidase
MMTREADIDLLPNDRAALINRMEPTIAVSVHYNALPDAGDAINTAGIGNFWYNTQSHSLAQFLHDYLVRELDRPSYGVFWNNLALTRPTVAPAVLLELGFMINPTEFEWIANEREQERLADALADGITEWFRVKKSQF